MKVTLLCMGKTQSLEIKRLMSELIKRIPPYINFEIKEIADLKNTKNLTPTQWKMQEWQKIESQIQPTDTTILLDENGKEYTSENFAKKLQEYMNNSHKHLVFVVGGAYGFPEEILKKYPEKLALSKMTFTHQMVRYFFVEQLYRAYTIIEGKPYHNP